MNVLLLGSDSRDPDRTADSRTDTIVLLHLDADHQKAEVISIPRDTWAFVPKSADGRHGNTMAKINSPFAWGGTPLTGQTVETFTGVHIDHVALIDFAGFEQVVDALGGVDLTIEKTITSIHAPHRTFQKGTRHLDGAAALDYVRQRYQFTDGDFSRERHQREFLQALLDRAASIGTLSNPVKLNTFLQAVTRSVTVDQDFELVNVALEMRDLRSDDLTFLGSPSAGAGMKSGLSVVLPDTAKAEPTTRRSPTTPSRSISARWRRRHPRTPPTLFPELQPFLVRLLERIGMALIAVGKGWRWASAGLVVLAVVAGCDVVGNRNQTPTAVATRIAASAPSGTPDLDAGEEIAQGFTIPWGLAFLPNGDALIAERDTGQMLRLTPGGGAPQQVYQVPGVAAGGEGGLLGLAVSPTFADDNLIYAFFTAEQDNRIARFRLDGGQPEVIFDGIAKAQTHNGGRIAFGPDGMLYVGTGDAGEKDRAQDPASPNGKILRLTPNGAPAPGNPTAGSPVYSLGHRNVQGLAWNSAGRLFATELGQNEQDEVNLIQPGHNYGWPKVEGTGDTDGGRYTNPLVTWPTRDASPSGIAIAGNTAYVAALRGQRLWTIPLNGDTAGDPSAHLEGRYGRLRTVQIAPDGALWLTTSNNDGSHDVHDGDDRIIRFPAH